MKDSRKWQFLKNGLFILPLFAAILFGSTAFLEKSFAKDQLKGILPSAETKQVIVGLDAATTSGPQVISANSTNGTQIASFRVNTGAEDIYFRKLSVKFFPTVKDLDGDSQNDTYDCDPTLSGIQTACYTDAIADIQLFNEDGTAILKTDGSTPTFPGIFGGIATFSNLDLTVHTHETKVILIKVWPNRIQTTNIGRSGMVLRAALSFLNSGSVQQYQIIGATSGLNYGDAEISVDDEATEVTGLGEPVYLMGTNVKFTTANPQTTTLVNAPIQDILKFSANPSDNTSAYLKSIIVNVYGIDANENKTLNIQNVSLYAGKMKIGTGVATSRDTWRINVDSSYADKVTVNGSFYDVIPTTGKIYTLRADISGVESTDRVISSIFANSFTPGFDGMIWRDLGTNGTDGVDMRWDNLHPDTSTSFLQNIMQAL